MDARIIDTFIEGLEKGNSYLVESAIKIAEGEPNFEEYDRVFAEIETEFAEEIDRDLFSGLKLFIWKIRKNFRIHIAIVTEYTKERAIEKIVTKIGEVESPLYVKQVQWDFKTLMNQTEPEVYHIESIMLGLEEVTDFVYYDR